MAAIAKVIVDLAVQHEFEYRIPPALQTAVSIGSRVLVPFGRAQQSGYVVGLCEQSERKALKDIRAVISSAPLVDGKMLEMARWIADYYGASLAQALQTLLPGAVRSISAGFRERLFATLVVPPPPEPARLTLRQQRILDVMRGAGNAVALRDLMRQAGVSGASIRALERKGWIAVAHRTLARQPAAVSAKTYLPTTPLPLMPAQAECLAAIRSALDDSAPSVILLHGVTGSGKTEVYLQAIAQVLERGQGVIVLVPEIALTPQTIERFSARFGEAVAVLHSHLSSGERHDEWHRLRQGNARIVIGARSAVFAPIAKLGLIVVDEEHENTYKQEDSPRYNARDVAVMRGRLEPCVVVLGSATPSLESYRNTQIGKYRLAVMPYRVDHRQMPAMRIVDMRIDAEKTGRVNVFSAELVEAIRLRLARAEQTMLFLNRRGYATALICPRCGDVAQCPQCSVAWTYHRQTEALHCHLCGGIRKVPERCPACGDPAFKYCGIGTQKVEEVVRKLFPPARIQRMDADMTATKDAHRRILGDFRTGKIDILVGTQMIAKGLDFPNVTLIGVVCADMTLHLPDFRAGERTFQLLTQVAGRAGRGDILGEVIVQTYTPHHPAIEAAQRMDYTGFCERELAFRRELHYPPFSHLVVVTLRSRSEAKAAFCATELERALRSRLPLDVVLSAPAPAPINRVRGYYRQQIMLRSKSVRRMNQALQTALARCPWPAGVFHAVDVDALSLL